MIVWTDPEEVEISVTLYKDAREGSPFEDKLWTFVIEDVSNNLCNYKDCFMPPFWCPNLCSSYCPRWAGASLEIIFWDLPVKMTSTNEFVPVMKQNVLVIVPDCQKHRIQNMQWLKSLNT